MKSVIIFLLIIFLNGCEKMDEFTNLSQVDKITISVLKKQIKYDAINVEKLEFINSFEIKGDNKKEFEKIFTNKNNYETVSRRCKFIPIYSISIEGKVVALFDDKYCPRIVYLNNSKDIIFDIVNNSNISNYIKKITTE